MIVSYSRTSLRVVALCFVFSIVAPPLALAAGMGGAPSGAGSSGSSSATSSASNGGASGAAAGPNGGGRSSQGYMAICEQGKTWDDRNNRCL
jgi:hypothetical protein